MPSRTKKSNEVYTSQNLYSIANAGSIGSEKDTSKLTKLQALRHLHFFVTHSPRFSEPISKEGEKNHKPRANELYFLIIKLTSKFLLEVSLKFGCDLDCGLCGRDIRLANRVGQRRNTKIMFWMDYIPRYQF